MAGIPSIPRRPPLKAVLGVEPQKVRKAICFPDRCTAAQAPLSNLTIRSSVNIKKGAVSNEGCRGGTPPASLPTSQSHAPDTGRGLNCHFQRFSCISTFQQTSAERSFRRTQQLTLPRIQISAQGVVPFRGAFLRFISLLSNGGEPQ